MFAARAPCYQGYAWAAFRQHSTTWTVRGHVFGSCDDPVSSGGTVWCFGELERNRSRGRRVETECGSHGRQWDTAHNDTGVSVWGGGFLNINERAD